MSMVALGIGVRAPSGAMRKTVMVLLFWLATSSHGAPGISEK